METPTTDDTWAYANARRVQDPFSPDLREADTALPNALSEGNDQMGHPRISKATVEIITDAELSHRRLLDRNFFWFN